MIKDRHVNISTNEEGVLRRWKDYFEELLNEDNEKEHRKEEPEMIGKRIAQIRKDEVKTALKRIKSGKAVGPDDTPVKYGSA